MIFKGTSPSLMRSLGRLLAILSGSWLATGLAAHPVCAAEPGSWTVLVYWAVDNDLYKAGIPYLARFQETGSTKRLQIVAEIDYPGRAKKTERIQIFSQEQTQAKRDLDLPHSRVLERFDQEQDSADPATLERFLLWGMSRFPADHYLVILGSHGMNWRGIVEDHHSGTVMPLEGVRHAIESMNLVRGKKLDLIIMDACRMSFADTAYALRGEVRWMVGSQFDVNGFDHGPPIAALSARLTQNRGLTAAQLGKAYIEAYSHPDATEPNLSASLLHLEGRTVDSWTEDFREVLNALISLRPGELAQVRRQLEITRNSFGDHAIDFGNLIQALVDVAGTPHPQGPMASVYERYGIYTARKDARDGSVILSHFDPEALIQAATFTARSKSATGLSINCPRNLREYRKTLFAILHPEWLELCREWNL